MTLDIGLISHATALVAFLALSVVAALFWRGRPQRPALVVACLSTALWAGVIIGARLAGNLSAQIIQLSELLRDASWIFFLLQLASMRFTGEPFSLAGKRWLPLYTAGIAAALCLLFLAPPLSTHFGLDATLRDYAALTAWLGISIMGLLLVEQIFRNSSESERWSIKFLCLGLGGLFAYDFFMYAEGLLFRQLDPSLWQARGVVNALVAPALAISIARDSNWRVELSPSRQVVFHSVTLMGAGIYLVIMALAGYVIQFVGGGWGSLLQIAFLVGSALLLLILLFSGTIRAKTRVLLSKHFFSYKYDYREEWLKFTESLAGIGSNVPEGIVRSMAPLVQSPAGVLWGSGDATHYKLIAHWQTADTVGDVDITGLAAWLQQREWVIDIDELRREPDIYSGLTPPPWLLNIPDAWLVVPLMFQEQLPGILLLKRSDLQASINWEDRDLLKTAGRQAASHLAQHLSSEALVEARQFEAFNRLSAYVIHDLKNILAQQSLMVSNAEKHKHNPEFIDDMVTTVRNSVKRMSNLMEQMRSGAGQAIRETVQLPPLLEDAVAECQLHTPCPQLTIESGTFLVECDSDRLHTVFVHLIQNAQDATDKAGRVEVRLKGENGCAMVEIKDDGIGMNADFIRNRLFKPFDSTKGLTGMGIGAFESRDFIRSLQGDTIGSSAILRFTVV
jgi:putative PEP-CTERM system histidine kinase